MTFGDEIKLKKKKKNQNPRGLKGTSDINNQKMVFFSVISNLQKRPEYSTVDVQDDVFWRRKKHEQEGFAGLKFWCCALLAKNVNKSPFFSLPSLVHMATTF